MMWYKIIFLSLYDDLSNLKKGSKRVLIEANVFKNF